MAMSQVAKHSLLVISVMGRPGSSCSCSLLVAGHRGEWGGLYDMREERRSDHEACK